MSESRSERTILALEHDAGDPAVAWSVADLDGSLDAADVTVEAAAGRVRLTFARRGFAAIFRLSSAEANALAASLLDRARVVAGEGGEGGIP